MSASAAIPWSAAYRLALKLRWSACVFWAELIVKYMLKCAVKRMPLFREAVADASLLVIPGARSNVCSGPRRLRAHVGMARNLSKDCCSGGDRVHEQQDEQ
jgi:hypothetical protein